MTRYRNERTPGGVAVRSGFEARVLEALERDRIAFKYEPYTYNWDDRVRATCDDCGSNAVWRERFYTPDVWLGGDVFLEIKGKLTPDDRKTLIGVKENHPEVTLLLLWQRDNWMTKRHARRYSDWAREAGFASCVWAGSMPTDWLDYCTVQSKEKA